VFSPTSGHSGEYFCLWRKMNGLGGRVLFGGWPEEGDEMP
jgi:hypothetical protein